MSRKKETHRPGFLLLILAVCVLSLTLVACGHKANQESVNNTNASASQSIQSNQSTGSNSDQSTGGNNNQSASSNSNQPASNSSTGGSIAGNGGVKSTDQQVQNALHALDGAQHDVNSSSNAAAQDQNAVP
jgi:hypothetical protein